MASLQSLPAEILRIIPSYLSRVDLFSLLDAEHSLHQPITRTLRFTLFRKIYWSFSGLRRPLPEEDDFAVVADPHRLIKVLQAEPRAASEIKILVFDYDNCSKCPPFDGVGGPAPCRMFYRNWKVLSKLTSIQHLTLQGSFDIVINRGFRPPPALINLRIGALTRGDGSNPPTIALSMLEPFLRHPALRKVVVEKANELENDGAIRANSRSISNITDLFLSAVLVEPEAVTRLVSKLDRLEVFAFSRHGNMRGRTGGTYAKNCWNTLWHLSTTLHSLHDSVTQIAIFYHKRDRWIRDRTLLQPFNYFINLRKLTIDPSMLLGRVDCPAKLPNPNVHARPALSLASLLPQSLEYLYLVLDIEQAARIPNYRDDMLQGLLSTLLDDQILIDSQSDDFDAIRGREPKLPNLKNIIMAEFTHSHGYERCNCNPRNRVCPLPIKYRDLKWIPAYRAKYPPMTAKEAFRFVDFKQSFQVLGVVLEYLNDEDYEARWEYK